MSRCALPIALTIVLSGCMRLLRGVLLAASYAAWVAVVIGGCRNLYKAADREFILWQQPTRLDDSGRVVPDGPAELRRPDEILRSAPPGDLP